MNDYRGIGKWKKVCSRELQLFQSLFILAKIKQSEQHKPAEIAKSEEKTDSSEKCDYLGNKLIR